MREVNAILGKEIFLGRCGENLASFVTFNISDWQRVYGNGTAQLIHQRNGDKIPYPCVIEQTDNTVTWRVTNADVATAGRGRVELQYYVGETLAKSETYTTVTERAMGPASETPPDPYNRWMDSMLGMASETQVNAEAAAESAQSAAQSAASVAESAAAAKNSEALTLSYLEDAKTNAGWAIAAADEATAAMRAAEASKAAAAISEGKAKQSAESVKADADRAEAARESIVLDEAKMAQTVADAAASASAAEVSKTAAANSASNAAQSAASVGNAAATASAAATKATSEADRAKAEADRAAGAAGGDFVIKTGDTMTGNLEISKGIPMLSFTVPNGEAYAEIKKNAGTDVDMGININDFTSEGNYTQLNISHKDKALRLRVMENGVATGAYDIYHEGNKPTASDVGAVGKAGDTMTGNLKLQPYGDAYSVVKKNADSSGDYGLQMQDYGDDGSFMGLTVSAKSQKLEFKKKAAGATEYTYSKIYSSDNPPAPEDVNALPIWGGTMTGALTLSGDPYEAKHAATKQYVDAVGIKADAAQSAADSAAAAAAAAQTTANGKEAAGTAASVVSTHNSSSSAHSDIRTAVSNAASAAAAAQTTANNAQTTADGKAPMYQYSTTDLTAGSSALTTGTMYLCYE